jgi:hypothetical protein
MRTEVSVIKIELTDIALQETCQWSRISLDLNGLLQWKPAFSGNQKAQREADLVERRMHFPTGRVAFASLDGLTVAFPGWQKPVPEWWFLRSFAIVFLSYRGCSESTRLTLLHGEHNRVLISRVSSARMSDAA